MRLERKKIQYLYQVDGKSSPEVSILRVYGILKHTFSKLCGLCKDLQQVEAAPSQEGDSKARFPFVGPLVFAAAIQSLSQVLATPWTVARQKPLPMGFPGENMHVGYHFLPQWIFPPEARTCVSCLTDRFFITEPAGKPLVLLKHVYLSTGIFI